MIPVIVALSTLLVTAIVLLIILSKDHSRVVDKLNSLIDDHKQLQSHINEPPKLDREMVMRRVLEDFAESEYGYAKFTLRILYGKQK